MPLTIKHDAINIKNGNNYDGVSAFLIGDVNAAVKEWLNAHPEATTPDGSLSYKKLVLGTLGFVIPEMFGAYGDGVNDDTEALQDALDSGINVVAPGTYAVSSVNVKDTTLTILGEIDGQVVINNNGIVKGGTIRQNSADPCVVFESVISGKGYLNGALKECNLVPTESGVGIKLYSNSNPLFGFLIENVDIASCEKSIWFYSNRWITKGSIENVFCHSPKYAIFIDNLQTTNTQCGDFTFKNVYAQYNNGNPINFFRVNTGNCLAALYDSFCYDGIGEYTFYIPSGSDSTRITIQGQGHFNPASSTFVNKSDIRAFNFYPQTVERSLLIKPSNAEGLPKDKIGSIYFESFLNPALSGSRFFGFVGRGGTTAGASEPNKVFGVSCYDGRLSILRSTDGTISNGNVVEVSTPYSGAVYTTSTLPTGVRDGAKCWCSDIKMDVTYYNGKWYRPDGTEIE